MNHVVKYANALESNHPIRCYPNKNSEFCGAFHRISDESFGQSLISLGCVPRKSLILRWPPKLPHHLNSHFIRGYHDGDGCLSFGSSGSRITFAGTKEFIESLQKTINFSVKEAAKGSVGKDSKSFCYKLCYSGNKSPIAVLDWIYEDSTVDMRLNRKYALYQHHKQAASMESTAERVAFLKEYHDGDDYARFSVCSNPNCSKLSRK